MALFLVFVILLLKIVVGDAFREDVVAADHDGIVRLLRLLRWSRDIGGALGLHGWDLPRRRPFSPHRLILAHTGQALVGGVSAGWGTAPQVLQVCTDGVPKFWIARQIKAPDEDKRGKHGEQKDDNDTEGYNANGFFRVDETTSRNLMEAPLVKKPPGVRGGFLGKR